MLQAIGARPTYPGVMEARSFHLRSVATHEGDDNRLVNLDLEMESEGRWEQVAFTPTLAPFHAFVCTALMCQHGHLRMTAAERGLSIGEARGELFLTTEDWIVSEIRARFELELRHGEPTPEDLDYVAERVRECPISRNLPEARKETVLEVVTDQ